MKHAAEAAATAVLQEPKKPLLQRLWKQRAYFLLMLVPVVLYVIFNYWPFYYVSWAFTNYGEVPPSQVSWVGFAQFEKLFSNSDFKRALLNTLSISFKSLLWGFPIPILFALFLDEMGRHVKKVLQTIIVFPNFLSFVIVASIWYLILAPTNSVNSEIAKAFGQTAIYWFGTSKYIQGLLVASGIWQGAGYSAIVYLAAISAVDTSLFEAAKIDGANRLQQMWYIKLPCISSTIIICLIMSLGGILGVFDNVIIMAQAVVYDKADVLMTMAYRAGIKQMKLGYGMAVSVFKAVVSFALVLVTNWLSRRFSESSLF